MPFYRPYIKVRLKADYKACAQNVILREENHQFKTILMYGFFETVYTQSWMKIFSRTAEHRITFLVLGLSLFLPAWRALDVAAQIPLPLMQTPMPINSYRGKRAMDEEAADAVQRRFVVEKISVEQASEFLKVIVLFNIPVNPLSIHEQSVFINNKMLPKTSILKFNRTGTELQLIIPVETLAAFIEDEGESNADFGGEAENERQDLSVVLYNITSYDSSKFDEQQIDELEFNVS